MEESASFNPKALLSGKGKKKRIGKGERQWLV